METAKKSGMNILSQFGLNLDSQATGLTLSGCKAAKTASGGASQNAFELELKSADGKITKRCLIGKKTIDEKPFLEFGTEAGGDYRVEVDAENFEFRTINNSVWLVNKATASANQLAAVA